MMCCSAPLLRSRTWCLSMNPRRRTRPMPNDSTELIFTALAGHVDLVRQLMSDCSSAEQAVMRTESTQLMEHLGRAITQYTAEHGAPGFLSLALTLGVLMQVAVNDARLQLASEPPPVPRAKAKNHTKKVS